MKVQVEKTFHKPVEKVYSAAKQLHLLAKQIPIIQKVEILEEGPNWVKARWSALLDIAGMSQSFSWVQKDTWDDEKMLCTFEMTEGQFKQYQGIWEFYPDTKGCRAVLTVHYDVGLGLLGPFFQQILNKMVRDACEMWLTALEKILL
ncbi:MAG: type II toxin-antitoxin system RatA family toxin [bacterium JZ-2024 1]